MERIVFLTGRLAQASLERVLASMDAPFAWEVREIGLQVAGLMTADLIRRRVNAPVAADRIIVPGRCRGDLDALTTHYGIPVVQHHASTFEEGVQRGYADVVRAMGDYNYNTSLAAINAQQAYSYALENRKQAVQDYFELREMNRQARGLRPTPSAAQGTPSPRSFFSLFRQTEFFAGRLHHNLGATGVGLLLFGMAIGLNRRKWKKTVFYLAAFLIAGPLKLALPMCCL